MTKKKKPTLAIHRDSEKLRGEYRLACKELEEALSGKKPFTDATKAALKTAENFVRVYSAEVRKEGKRVRSLL